MRILLASSNPGKLREYQAMGAQASLAAGGATIEFAMLPGFVSLPAFDESAPTFAENAAGKAMHFSRHADDRVVADDSGLVVPALGGAPGVNSARYAGAEATDADRVQKLLAELRKAGAIGSAKDQAPEARFVCVLAVAQHGRLLAVFSDCVDGVVIGEPRGNGGFGYDPVFFYPPMQKTFAEIPREAKNQVSHRGKAFQKLLTYLKADIPRDNRME